MASYQIQNVRKSDDTEGCDRAHLPQREVWNHPRNADGLDTDAAQEKR